MLIKGKKFIIAGPALVIVVLLTVYFARNLLNFNESFIAGIDIIGCHYWNAEFIRECFRMFNIPLWNPYFYSGHPFLANPSNFVFYPSTILYVALPLPWAFNLDILLHLLLAALGGYYLVYLITQSKEAGIATAIVYCLSGYFIERIFAGHIALVHAAAIIPWVFYFIEKYFISDKVIFLIGAGLVLGLQILSGDPQINYYTALFATIYFFLRYISISKGSQIHSFKHYFLYYLLLPAISFGVGAIQILPAYEFMSLSERTGNSFEFATFMSFPPQNFLTFLVPRPQTTSLYVFWEFGCYLGIFALVLAGIGLFLSKKRDYTICYGMMLLISITILLGHYTPLYKLYYVFLPLLKTFRVPARCLVIFDFLMSVLVGLGIQYIIYNSLRRRQSWSVIGGIALLVAGLFVGVHVFEIPWNSKGVIIALVFICLSIITISLIPFIKSKQLIAALIIGILFIDLFVNYSHIVPNQNIDKLVDEKSFEKLFKEEEGLFRVLVPGFGDVNNQLYGLPSRGMKYHYYGINGSSQLILDRYFEFVYYMADLPKPMLTRHTFSPDLFRPDLAFSSKILGVKHAIVLTDSGFQMLTSDKVQPRALIVKDAIYTPGYDEQIQLMKRADFDSQRTILLAESDREIINKEYEAYDRISEKLDNELLKEDESVRIFEYSPNRIDMTSRSSNNAILLLSENYYPGWKAYVDGNEVPILRADYILRAIPLPAGQHEIVFVYRPLSFLIGGTIAIVALMFIVLMFIKRDRIKW